MVCEPGSVTVMRRNPLHFLVPMNPLASANHEKEVTEWKFTKVSQVNRSLS